MNPTHSLSVVIPVYNGADTLPALVACLARELPGVASSYEVILVDDCSPDRSWELIGELSQRYPWVRGVHLMRNYGQHNALLCGVRLARYELTLTMDDDLQHPPEEIAKLIAKLDEGYDVVYGNPLKMPHAAWRNAFSFFTKRALASIMGVKTVRDIGAFRLFRTGLRRAFASYRNPNVLLDVLLSWGASRFAVVRVNHAPRPAGHSNYNFFKLFSTTMMVLTAFSTLPLRFASLLGLAFTLFGLGVLVYVLVLYFTAGSIPGFPFLASIISVFSGAQLFALGIFGEYLARMFDRSMDRPIYVIGEETRPPEAESQGEAPPQLSLER